MVNSMRHKRGGSKHKKNVHKHARVDRTKTLKERCYDQHLLHTSKGHRSTVRLTCDRLQTLDEGLHVPLARGLVQIEVRPGRLHLVPSVRERLVHVVLFDRPVLHLVAGLRHRSPKSTPSQCVPSQVGRATYSTSRFSASSCDRSSSTE